LAFTRHYPPETRLFARQFANRLPIVAGAWIVLALLLNAFAPNRPVERGSERDHFLYGSIGSDIGGGLPVEVLRVLPELFPQYLPPGAPRDLTAFGFIQEPGEPLPIGFSIRRQIVDRTAINCGACHTGTVRETPDAQPMTILGMPAVTVDLGGFFRFLFDVAADENFTAETILAALDEKGRKGWLDGLIYRIGIPQMRDALLAREERNRFLFEPGYPKFLPGRVNTFDTFKVDQFHYFYQEHGQPLDPDEMYGIVDFPSVWNQRPRDGIWLHWDGNQASVRERNFSAAIGAGARPHDMDVDSLFRVEAWLNDLPPPPYPFAIDAEFARRGEAIYMRRCAECHDFGRAGLGHVIPVEEIGTDPYREISYTDFLRRAQIDYTAGYFWQFRNFRDTNGYASHPLDGIWARAPYLHNGAVPSMWDLLSPAALRPRAFEVGVDVYDQERMGFAAARLIPAGDGFAHPDGTPYAGTLQVLDTRVKGNGNGGHEGPRYGTDLPDADKRALIEYLKTK
jgi:mono/diheme cytochrome c family protein